MPWKVSNPMTERLKFIARYLEGERMTDLCNEFSISRKTGYKLVRRYEEFGSSAFVDQSTSPKSHPNQTSFETEKLIIELRGDHPTWGARKIEAYLRKRHKSVTAKSIIHAILQRNNLVKSRRRRPYTYKAEGTVLSVPDTPNSLWCTDFKGQFKLKNKQYCYPLTVTDQYSRYLLACEAFENTKEDACIATFKRLFREFGVPDAIKSDNGVPFASRSIFGLSKLSVYWLRCGIQLERSRPGCPQDNGSHERMHSTLKADATKPPKANILSQQEAFEAFQSIYNYEIPHEAIEMKTPSELYTKSTQEYDPDMPALKYPNHDITTRTTNCGKIFINNKKHRFKVTIGIPFGGHNVGLNQIDEGIWSVSFMHYDLGFFDSSYQKLSIPENPFLKKRGTYIN